MPPFPRSSALRRTAAHVSAGRGGIAQHSVPRGVCPFAPLGTVCTVKSRARRPRGSTHARCAAVCCVRTFEPEPGPQYGCGTASQFLTAAETFSYVPSVSPAGWGSARCGRVRGVRHRRHPTATTARRPRVACGHSIKAAMACSESSPPAWPGAAWRRRGPRGVSGRVASAARSARWRSRRRPRPAFTSSGGRSSGQGILAFGTACVTRGQGASGARPPMGHFAATRLRPASRRTASVKQARPSPGPAESEGSPPESCMAKGLAGAGRSPGPPRPPHPRPHRRHAQALTCAPLCVHVRPPVKGR